jgi:hypothetical protein
MDTLVCNFDVDVDPSSLPMLTTQESTVHSYVIIILVNRKCITLLLKKNIVLNLNKCKIDLVYGVLFLLRFSTMFFFNKSVIHFLFTKMIIT